MSSSRLSLSPTLLLSLTVLLILYARPTHAFGAGNIASTARIEGQNWRHGDIEDTLLTLLMTRAAGGKKFSKMDVKRVYFGNWLRDYSQAVDVGTVKMVSAEAIRILLWILGFLSFGYGTKEFEVTRDRLGCYRPEEHIDNPKDYADNLDARQYDRRLRGPVDERRELGVDERTGLKNYIASEDLGITTSAGLVRNLFRRSIELGRQYNRSQNKADLYEALRLLGTGCHCLEDYSAHSNYTELALIEMGERNVFPHVGRRTQIQIRGTRQPVYPLVTGTFGGVDFLHSVMGELSDKSTQSELQELEGTISAAQSQQQDKSIIRELLSKLPDGLFGGKDEAGKADELQANAAAAQMQNMHITPKEPEAFTQQLGEITKQIYPILEFHDEIMQSINEAVEKIPILPDLIEQIQNQINIFVFSLLAPFVLPVIRQVKTELATGSSEIIQSSRDKQLIVFRDDHSTDPTHSMLSKDHFSNVLNEPAGKVASQVLKWVVPQLVECWDNERIDAERTVHRIVNGVFHHPAMREYGDDGARDGRLLMFGVVERWWQEMSETEKRDLRDKLSRDGVESGRNHKEGVHDSGHGCGKPLGMPNARTAASSGAIGGAVLGGLGQALGGQQQQGRYGVGGRTGSPANAAFEQVGKVAGEAVGGGALGAIVGGVVGGVGASLLGNAFSQPDDETNAYKQQGYNQDGSYTTSLTETGWHRPDSPGAYGEEKYGQAAYKRTEYPGGGVREEYKRYEQDGRDRRTGYGFENRVDTRPQAGGGYARTEERKWERPGGQWQSEVRREEFGAGGQYRTEETKHYSGRGGRKDSNDDDDDDESGDGEDYEKKERKRREKEEKRRRKEEKKYQKKRSDDEESDDEKRRRQPSGYGHGGQEYGQETRYGAERQYGEERREEGYGAGRRQEYGGGYGEEGREEYGGRGNQRRAEYGTERRQEYETGFGGERRQQLPGGFEQEERPSYGETHNFGRRQEYGESQEYAGRQGYGRQQEPEYGVTQGYGRRQDYGEGQEYSGRQEYGAQQEYGRGDVGRAGLGGPEEGYGRGDADEMPGGFGAEDEHGVQKRGYSGAGGYGGEDEYGERRRW